MDFPIDFMDLDTVVGAADTVGKFVGKRVGDTVGAVGAGVGILVGGFVFIIDIAFGTLIIPPLPASELPR